MISASLEFTTPKSPRVSSLAGRSSHFPTKPSQPIAGGHLPIQTCRLGTDEFSNRKIFFISYFVIKNNAFHCFSNSCTQNDEKI